MGKTAASSRQWAVSRHRPAEQDRRTASKE